MYKLVAHGRGQSCSEANQEDNHGQERWFFSEQVKVQKKKLAEKKKYLGYIMIGQHKGRKRILKKPTNEHIPYC